LISINRHRQTGQARILVCHGGSWQSANEENVGPDRYLAPVGLVASVDYVWPRAPSFPLSATIVFAAITYLKNHADQIGLDKTRLVLLGRSAGGQMALAAAYAGKEPAIKGVVVFYAPNDLLWGYSKRPTPLIMNSRKVNRNLLGGTPSQVPMKL